MSRKPVCSGGETSLTFNAGESKECIFLSPFISSPVCLHLPISDAFGVRGQL